MRCLLLLIAIAHVLAFSSGPKPEPTPTPTPTPMPTPTPAPSDTKGCFNFYSGTCSNCGQPALCGVGHDGEQKRYSMPTWYTGSSPYCAHCYGGEGCWDGTFCNHQPGTGQFDEECAKEHCTCVEERECVADSPAYVECEACGADVNPEQKELPQPVDPANKDRCYHMDPYDGEGAHKCHCEQTKEECTATGGFWTDTCLEICGSSPPSPPQLGPFNVWEFTTKEAFDACDFSVGSATYLPYDDPSVTLTEGQETNTVIFGNPALNIDTDMGPQPVRYFGGSPDTYCKAGQKLAASGGITPQADEARKSLYGVDTRGITFRQTLWGDPSEWKEGKYFTFSFVGSTDKIIFDYPKHAESVAQYKKRAAKKWGSALIIS